MALRTIDLSGLYTIDSVTANKITLVDPELINPNWHYNDLTGVGSTGYAQNIAMIKGSAGVSVTLDGTYTIAAITPSQITLDDPESENSDWGLLSLFEGLATQLLSSNIAKTTSNWEGPFIIDKDDTTIVVANFIAQAGLFKDDGKKQIAFPITVELELTPVDSNDDPIGPPEIFQTTVPGNSKGRESRAITLVAQPTFQGRCQVRARRTTFADYAYEGTVVDEVKWADLYAMSPAGQSDFGDVTTVHSRTYATEGALAVKERKLNCLATRKVPIRIDGENFGPESPTRFAGDILVAAAVDPFIGGRQLSELDLDAIYGALDDVEAYFGDVAAVEFGYTFDDNNTSFEETIATIAQAVFCSAFRQGAIISLQADLAGFDAALLFNHRNILPRTQERTVRFGVIDDHDGVELDFLTADEGAPTTFSVKPEGVSLSPRQLEVPGIQSDLQAYWHCWRAWNRLRFQNIAVEFEATQEASLLIQSDRVLISDMTRREVLEGEVLDIDGTTLELSQPNVLDPAKNYTIFLQHIDMTVESLGVVAGADEQHVVISAPPRLDLSVDPANFTRATYKIVEAGKGVSRRFIIGEREPQSNFTETVRAVNYSVLYYANDELRFWLNPELTFLADSGPFAFPVLPSGGAGLAIDPDRGVVYQGGAGRYLSLSGLVAPASYTKAAWVKKPADGNPGHILSSAAGGHEAFWINDQELRAGHGGTFDNVAAALPVANVWTFVAVTFDADGGEMVLYVNDAAVDSGVAPARTLGALQAFALAGGSVLLALAQDVRFWKRALTADELLEVYRAGLV